MLFEVRLRFSSYSDKSAGVCVCIYLPFFRGVRVLYTMILWYMCMFVLSKYNFNLILCAGYTLEHSRIFEFVKALKRRWHFACICMYCDLELVFPIAFHQICLEWFCVFCVCCSYSSSSHTKRYYMPHAIQRVQLPIAIVCYCFFFPRIGWKITPKSFKVCESWILHSMDSRHW